MSTAPTAAQRDVIETSLPRYRHLLEEQWREQIGLITELSLETLTPRLGDASVRATAPEHLWVANRLLADVRRQLQDTEAALARIDTGRYGACERCGARIDANRLAALPAARYCLGCQRLQDNRR